ncbi:GntR family transcriptional regulator [Phytoactinopolyspora endophytica]|uniref:GntR family transcriptional regulator n=1 Tax=Phytoactinopolyspora endophytica TaxID=1642495 RepID=UPI00101CC4EC|nr:GntR family transcriptional regulator [Phytoactinopolyspora endophytica]
MAHALTRTVLREEIRNRLVERILDGTYPPGARVVESQLAREFGTSQAPVREALRDLEGMRFIETRPHRGARVREVTPEELGHMYPVRAALEEMAGREAAIRMTDEVVAALADEVEGMRRAAVQNDVRAQLTHDRRFHEIIVETAGNPVLLDVWHSLRIETVTLISAIKAHWDLRMIAEMHRPVLRALELRDSGLAASELKAHIEFFASLEMDIHRPARSPEQGVHGTAAGEGTDDDGAAGVDGAAAEVSVGTGEGGQFETNVVSNE